MRLWPMLLAAVIWLEPACHQAQQVETKSSDEAKNEQPGLFTVPQDQLARLKTTQVRSTNWQVAVHTTGTVDWDADHTTQAITQVNGPISRILVDQGTPVKKDDPLLYVSSPDVANAIAAYRKARNREAFNKRIVDRMKELLDRGAIAVKDYESSQADYNDATTDVQNSLQALRIFGITGAGDRRGREAGYHGQHGTGRALAHRRRDRAEAGLARHGDSGGPDGLLFHQRCFHRLGAGPHLRPRSARCQERRPGGRNQPLVQSQLSRRRFPTSEPSWIRPRAPRRCAS